MNIYNKWLDRVENLLEVQKDMLHGEPITARFARWELVELRMMIETLKEMEVVKNEHNA